MSGLEWEPFELPGDLRRRLAFIGTRKPPRWLAAMLDEDGRQALDDLAVIVLAEGMNRVLIRYHEIVAISERINAAVLRHEVAEVSPGARPNPWCWSMPFPATTPDHGRWTLPRHGRDRLGLDVPAAWGAAVLADFYQANASHFDRKPGWFRAVRRMREVGDAADELMALLARVTGAQGAPPKPVTTSTIDGAWKRLEGALAFPEVDTWPSRIIVTREVWNRIMLRQVLPAGANGHGV